MKTKEICNALRINENDILNIYPYGSKIYGNEDELSDSDFVIVYKKSLLPSGAFKDNAISSYDKEIQGTCYSRGGFIDALNNYQITALECVFLDDDKIIKKSMNFKIDKINYHYLIKNIISSASSSWHSATMAYKAGDDTYTKKNIYHALRILDFGRQIKDYGNIRDYSSSNNIKETIYNEKMTKPKNWHNLFIEMSKTMKDDINHT